MEDFLRPSESASRPAMAVNLVLFTVADEDEMRSLVDFGLVSEQDPKMRLSNGLSLLVVTLRAPEELIFKLDDAGSAGGRVLPFGFVEGDATLLETAHRIARQKLGIFSDIRLREAGIFDDPRRSPGARIVAFPYWGFVALDELKKSLGGPDRVGLDVVNSEFELERLGRHLEEFDGMSRFGGRRRPDLKRGHTKITSRELHGRKILALDGDDMVFYAWRKLRYAFTGPLDPFRYLGVPVLGVRFRLSDLKAFHDVARGEITQRDAFKRAVMNREFAKESGVMDKSRRGKPANLWELDPSISASLAAPRFPDDEI